ncbi:HAD domain-containing protein [Kitasatospora sp. NPDC049285]|uniref:HAD domain-containing protein n=1 Tax=Kitasatospora sp. NPDC049285 TaxID=3157096 RepID=UPI00344857E8
MDAQPLIFLDVDGPLIPFGGQADEYPARLTERQIIAAVGVASPLLSRLDPANGPRLAALPGRLVWATTWMADANACVAPLLGLPPLPVIDWPDPTEDEIRDVEAGLHWKTRPLVTWAAGQPFAWVDDEITPADRSWVAAHHPAPALLRRVDPRTGLTDDDFAALDSWLRAQV